ncbi:TetR family transcriptional regulator [Nocardia wallacei]|uniref:TetR family transcriptional regulator n=1 Tax=Nocardia wallacei TaxID=480035 RepID=UPI002455A491|nr:TetR family transcriptional regulator [Nocardia wallacei]
MPVSTRRAARAGLTRATVWARFPSKAALYLAVLTDHADAAFQGFGTSAGVPADLARTSGEVVRHCSSAATETRCVPVYFAISTV